MNELKQFHYFQTPVYTIKKPEFLETVRSVSKEYLKKTPKHQDHSVYPLRQTESFHFDNRLSEFSQFILDTSWNILDGQGYNMTNHRTYFDSMWLQEHSKRSSMEYHNHGNCHIVGFYFIKVPEIAPKAFLHDPRISKQMMELPYKQTEDVFIATNMVNFTPEEGSFIFTNSWVAHSFSRNAADKKFKFVHFNVTAYPHYQQSTTEQPVAEVI